MGSDKKSFPIGERKSMEKLDRERYLKRVIIVCWIALAICFGIKLFGGNLFEIMCNNENFIKVCEYADNHFWADYVLSSFYCFVSTYFSTLAMCGLYKYNKSQLIVVICTVLLGTVIKYFSSFGGVIFDFWQMIIMPCVFTLKNTSRHKFVLLGNGLIVLFQMASIYIKNIDYIIVTDYGLLVGIIYSLDVLLMIFIYYLYSNILVNKNKEEENG